MLQPEVWRKVDGQAVRCTTCEMNQEEVLNDGEGLPIGVHYKCVAMNEECIFLKKKIDDQKTYSDFREVYKDIAAELNDAIKENAGGDES